MSNLNALSNREGSPGETPDNPDKSVERVLDELVSALRTALGGDLVSVVLFGSAVAGHLRATSDVNVIVVLRSFDTGKLDAVREVFRRDRASVNLAPMFLLDSEVDLAAQSFPVKLADIARRRRVLWGADPFAQMAIPRAAEVAHLRQGLLNLLLRLRDAYIERSLRQEQLALAVAGAAGPLRSSAAALLELEGVPASTPKQALERLALELNQPNARAALAQMSEAREKGVLAPGAASAAMVDLMALTAAMLERARRVPEVAP